MAPLCTDPGTARIAHLPKHLHAGRPVYTQSVCGTRGAVHAEELGLYPTQATLVQEFVVPLPNAKLRWTAATPDRVTVRMALDPSRIESPVDVTTSLQQPARTARSISVSTGSSLLATRYFSLRTQRSRNVRSDPRRRTLSDQEVQTASLGPEWARRTARLRGACWPWAVQTAFIPSPRCGRACCIP